LALKPGMTTQTRIVIDSRENVLRVPNPALRYRPTAAAGQLPKLAQGQGRIWVLRNGAPAAVSVAIGLADDNFTEITSGALQLGDEVIVTERNGTASGTGRPPSLPRF